MLDFRFNEEAEVRGGLYIDSFNQWAYLTTCRAKITNGRSPADTCTHLWFALLTIRNSNDWGGSRLDERPSASRLSSFFHVPPQLGEKTAAWGWTVWMRVHLHCALRWRYSVCVADIFCLLLTVDICHETAEDSAAVRSMCGASDFHHISPKHAMRRLSRMVRSQKINVSKTIDMQISASFQVVFLFCCAIDILQNMHTFPLSSLSDYIYCPWNLCYNLFSCF